MIEKKKSILECECIDFFQTWDVKICKLKVLASL